MRDQNESHETLDNAVAQENATPQPQLTTERLILRPFCDDDEEAVQHFLQCKEIAANTRTIDHPYPDGAAKIWINKHPDLWQTRASAIFAICKKADPALSIGAIGLEINSADENAELGYWIGEPYWGQGICTEAARAIIEFGFTSLDLHKIHAHHLSRNPASGRVLAKIGMTREGEFAGHMKKWGVFEDIVFYGLVNPKT